jgi:hypothetical protein
VIKVCDKKGKAKVRLITCGTDKAEAKAVVDLDVPDPEPVVGKKIIQEAIGDLEEDDSKQNDS